MVQFQASRYIMRPNWTSVWQVMTILIFREHSLFNFEHLDILFAWIRHPSETLWSFDLLKSFHCSISSAWIYYPLESNFRVTSFDNLNFSRAFVVQLRAFRYVMRLNRTCECKVMIFWIAPELPLFNFGHLDILCSWIWPLCEKLWAFEFLESFRCSISSISIYYAHELDLPVQS